MSAFSRATIVPSVLSIILLLAAGRSSLSDGSDSGFVWWLVVMVCLILIWGSLTKDRPPRTIARWRPEGPANDEAASRPPH